MKAHNLQDTNLLLYLLPTLTPLKFSHSTQSTLISLCLAVIPEPAATLAIPHLHFPSDTRHNSH